MSRCRLEQVPLGAVPWDRLDVLPGRSVFCTRPWLEFLGESQQAIPVVARVLLDDRPVGWFSGAILRRLGLRVLGSPLPGWTTSYMGFDWDEPVRAGVRSAALAALRRWAFGPMRCVHLEVMDQEIGPTDELPPRMTADVFHSYRLDLADDASMLAGMRPMARRNIRRADARGVRVEEVPIGSADGFAEEYYAQALQSFAVRDTAPSYGAERIRSLVRHLHPSGHLVLLRARAEDGRCAATGIFAGLPGGTAVFLMGAADRELLGVRPNEAVMWSAMRIWRDRGAVTFDFGGGGIYKEKFGCRPVETAWVRSSALPGAEHARSAVRSRAARSRRRPG